VKIGDDVKAAEKPAGDFEPLPPGTYSVQIHEAKEGATSFGSPYVEVKAEILEGESKGRLVWDKWYLTEKALPYTLLRFEALGVDVDSIRGLDLQDYAQKILGWRNARIKTSLRDYTDTDPVTGDPRTRQFVDVKWWEADPERPNKPFEREGAIVAPTTSVDIPF